MQKMLRFRNCQCWKSRFFNIGKLARTAAHCSLSRCIQTNVLCGCERVWHIQNNKPNHVDEIVMWNHSTPAENFLNWTKWFVPWHSMKTMAFLRQSQDECRYFHENKGTNTRCVAPTNILLNNRFSFHLEKFTRTRKHKHKHNHINDE